MARHKLTEKNIEAMTAVCSVDGPVKLNRAGTSVRCAVAARSAQQRWTRLNPDKAAAGRAKKSAHKLTSRDLTTKTGECPECGTVGIVAQGRGYMCKNRADELWTTQQAEPQKRCGRCVEFFLNADGTCPYCDDEIALDLHKAIQAGEDLYLRRSIIGEEGFSKVIDTRHGVVDDRMEALESRVNGWPSLGAGVPAGVKPRHFINDWWATYGHLMEDN